MITYNYISAINRDYLEFDKAKVRKVLFNTNRTLGFSSTINKKCEQIIETSQNKLSVVEIVSFFLIEKRKKTLILQI